MSIFKIICITIVWIIGFLCLKIMKKIAPSSIRWYQIYVGVVLAGFTILNFLF